MSVSIGPVWVRVLQETIISIIMILANKAHRAMWTVGSGCGDVVSGHRVDSSTTLQRKAHRETVAARARHVMPMAGREQRTGEEATVTQKRLVIAGQKRARVVTVIGAGSAMIQQRRVQELELPDSTTSTRL